MIFRSPYPDVAIPDVTWTAFALREAERLADKAALIDAATGQQMIYRDLATAIDRAAAGLAELGVRKGDVVTIFAPNSVDYVIAAHAIASSAAIFSAANPLYGCDELRHLLQQHGTQFLITTPDTLGLAEAAAAASAVTTVIAFGDVPGVVSFASLLASTATAPRVEIDPARDIAALLC